MGCNTSAPENGGAQSEAKKDAGTSKVYSMQEVRQHRSMNDCWVAVDGMVYRLPPHFLAQHPGGMQAVLASAGTDATRVFNSVHSLHAKKRLQTFCIGQLAPPPPPPQQPAPHAQSEATTEAGQKAAMHASAAQQQQQQQQQIKIGSIDATGTPKQDATPQQLPQQQQQQLQQQQPPGGASLGSNLSPAAAAAVASVAVAAVAAAADAATDAGSAVLRLTPAPAVTPGANADAPCTLQGPSVPINLQLTQRTQISPNTYILRFALPSPGHRLGLPCGHHVRLSATIDGENVARPYTPLSDDTTLGFVDILVKVYFPGVHPSYPAGGQLSYYMHNLAIGDYLTFTGPTGKFLYAGRGAYARLGTKGSATHLSMVAGGTGITPIYAVMQAVLRDPSDTTTMSLIFANLSEEDILIRKELEALAEQHPDRLKLYFVVATAPEGWTQGSGLLTPGMMAERLFPPGPTTLGLMCGPPGLVEQVCIPGFQAMGYKSETIVRF